MNFEMACSHRRLDTGRPESDLVRGKGAVQIAHSAGIAGYADGGDVPAR